MKKENTRIEQNAIDYEQKIIDSLYIILKIINVNSTQLKEFELLIKKSSNNVTLKVTGELNLKKELDQVIQYLNDFEQSNTLLKINVKNVFLGLETIIKSIDPLDFEEEIFSGFNKIVNKLILCFSKTHKIEQRQEWEEVTLKYGDLVALICNVVITKINVFSKTLSHRLDIAEKENLLINNKILDLEKTYKNQIRTIEQLHNRIKILSS